MGQMLTLHEVTPQGRFLDRAADTLRDGGVVVLPTDTSYALVSMPGEKDAVQRIVRLRELDSGAELFSLIVPDLADVARYAQVSNPNYRILRRHLPGPYTFVLPATRAVPRILGVKRKTIGLRVPDHTVPRQIADRLGGAVFATTLSLPGEERPLSDPDEIVERVGSRVDLILAQGNGGLRSSTVVDLTGNEPVVLRVGVGEPAPFE